MLPGTRFGQGFRRRLGLIVAACWLIGGGPMGFGAFAGPPARSFEAASNPCEEAGIAAEQAGGLPSGLLLAIGRVESGRWDSAAGRVIAWPWTINAAGRGQWFANEAAAALTVRTLLDGGTRSIDVGCFQINLMWHPTAFASLEQAFDPVANANYAARFLLGLFGQTGSWEAAVEAYHSAVPALGFAYRQQVFATWSAAPPVPTVVRSPMRMVAVASQPRPVAMPVVIAGVQVWTPMPRGTGAEVVAMPGAPVADPSQAVVRAVTPALPVVSYRVMPAGLVAGRVTPPSK
jgi:transglycosylase-like protein with SLT domain